MLEKRQNLTILRSCISSARAQFSVRGHHLLALEGRFSVAPLAAL